MRERPLCTFCLLFLIFQIIFIRGFQMGKDWKPSLFEQKVEEGTVATLSGKVYQKEEKKDNLVVYLATKAYQTNILVYFKQNNSNGKEISIGNEIEVTGTVAFFDEPRNPGNFNEKFFYQKQGIHGKIFASAFTITNKRKNAWKEELASLRVHWKNMFIQVLGEENGNAMSAILLGDKSDLDSDLKELYQKNGIGHILAISGLHMTFIGVGFYQFLRKRGFSFASAGMIGIVFLISYTMMIGNGVASMRALVMFIVRIGADITGRVYDMLTALALAAIVILVWHPLYLYDAGFLLSFGAILGALIIYPTITIPHKKDSGIRQKIMERILNTICGSISINLAILPCMLYFYFEYPLYSVFLNLMIIPLMSVILGAGVIGIVVSSIVPIIGNVLGGGILYVCGFILSIYKLVCEWCILLPGSHFVIGVPKVWQILSYYFLLIVAICLMQLLKRKKEEKRESLKGSHSLKNNMVLSSLYAAAILIICVNWQNVFSRGNSISITMLDVGQGDGFVIHAPNGSTCMIDGGSSDVKEVGKYRIESYLKSQGIGTLDYAFVSHGDMDHFSGIEEMLQRQKLGVRIRYLVLPVKEVLDQKLLALAQTADENGTAVLLIKPEQSIEIGSALLTCLQPSENYEGEIGNASSMILSLSYQKFDMLFTGDVEGDGESLLSEKIQEYQKKNNIQYEVLKVPHHGSKNSSSSKFLSIVSPKISLISAGKNNRYGHPHKETISRLQGIQSEIISTQKCGAVSISTDGMEIQIDRNIK